MGLHSTLVFGSAQRRGVSQSASAAITPDQIAGLIGWWKADTIGLGNGAQVSSWADSSGNGHTATAVGSAAVTYSTAALNGLPVVHFANGKLDVAAFVLPAAWTTFVVARSTSGVLPQQILNADGNPPRMFQYRFNTALLEVIGFNTVPSAFTDSEAATLANYSYLTGRFDAATAVQAWVNGVSGGSTAATGTGNSVSSAIRFGQDQAGANPLTGDIAEIVYYNTALTAANRQSVESYLKARYAL